MMKKVFLRFLVVGFLIIFLFIGMCLEKANAIPPFARKYQTNCQTCHTAFPKLNPFGMAFRANGYRFPGGDEMFIKDEPISLGAPANKRLWPKSVWPSDIPYLPPIGFTMFSNLFIGEDNEQTTEFDGIEEFGLLLGGTLGESWAFFFDFRLALWNQTGWIDRAHIIYTPRWVNSKLAEWAGALFNKEVEDPAGIFNIQIGQFEPRAAPSFGGHRNLITMKGQPTNVMWPVLPIGNFWGFFPNQKGVEFFGALNGPGGNGGFEWAAGIVNGEQSGTLMFGQDNFGRLTNSGDREFGRFDDNDFKDYYGRLSYKIGGLGVMGGGEVEATAKAVENWQDGYTLFGDVKSSAKFGIFYYRGKSDFKVFNTPVRGVDNQDRFSRYGVDLDWIIGNFDIVGSGVVYDDNLEDAVTYNVGFPTEATDDQFKTYIYTAEVNWVVYPWLHPAVRYEWIQPDYEFTSRSAFAKDSEQPVTSQRFERLTFDVAILAAANIKLLAGYHVSIGEPPPGGSHFRDHFRVGVNIDF